MPEIDFENYALCFLSMEDDGNVLPVTVTDTTYHRDGTVSVRFIGEEDWYLPQGVRE